jgi:transcription elongation factor GreA-like protein
MNLLPLCYYHKEILEIIEQYLDEDYTSFDNLSPPEKEMLIAVCIKHVGIDALQMVTDNHKEQIIHHLHNYMLLGDSRYATDLAEVLNKNAVDYYSQRMSFLFEELYEERQNDILRDMGLRQVVDPINGEIMWQ